MVAVTLSQDGGLVGLFDSYSYSGRRPVLVLQSPSTLLVEYEYRYAEYE